MLILTILWTGLEAMNIATDKVSVEPVDIIVPNSRSIEMTCITSGVVSIGPRGPN